MKTYSYQDLIVWQKSMTLAKDVYLLTATFPPEERFGLSSQMQRAAVAIPSNIAEGHLRHHQKEFLYFLSVAQGSAGELETQLLVCQSLEHLNSKKVSDVLQEVEEVKKMLYVFCKKLNWTPLN